MIHWDTKKLAVALKNKTLKENEKLMYLLASSISFAVLLFMASLPPGESNQVYLVTSTLMSLIVLIAGLFIAFQRNANGDNRAFIERVICLSWPLGVKQFLALLPISIFLQTSLNQETGDLIWLGVATIAEIIFYWRLVHWIQHISQLEPVSPSP